MQMTWADEEGNSTPVEERPNQVAAGWTIARTHRPLRPLRTVPLVPKNMQEDDDDDGEDVFWPGRGPRVGIGFTPPPINRPVEQSSASIDGLEQQDFPTSGTSWEWSYWGDGPVEQAYVNPVTEPLVTAAAQEPPVLQESKQGRVTTSSAMLLLVVLLIVGIAGALVCQYLLTFYPS